MRKIEKAFMTSAEQKLLKQSPKKTLLTGNLQLDKINISINRMRNKQLDEEAFMNTTNFRSAQFKVLDSKTPHLNDGSKNLDGNDFTPKRQRK